MTTSARRGKQAAAQAKADERIAEPRIGWVAGADEQGELLVDFPGNPLGPIPARSTVAVSAEEAFRAARERQGVVLLFEKGEPALPLVMGLLKTPSSTPLTDRLLDDAFSRVPIEARVDGKRVVIEGREEVVIRCGKASLTLRRDGQIRLRGVNVSTEAEQVQKIKGGNVQIN
ncbi:DUF6484 domain-containing protein [Myxococcus vastator]|uniref:DUF6484 domain-containing protein n=1 Tax=Myxococcus vastator TaxID=2709664 RepID=UPI0013D3C4FA|nr:DUF6484 domain-containing protein [Myxococcus vastator]